MFGMPKAKSDFFGTRSHEYINTLKLKSFGQDYVQNSCSEFSQKNVVQITFRLDLGIIHCKSIQIPRKIELKMRSLQNERHPVDVKVLFGPEDCCEISIKQPCHGGHERVLS